MSFQPEAPFGAPKGYEYKPVPEDILKAFGIVIAPTKSNRLKKIIDVFRNSSQGTTPNLALVRLMGGRYGDKWHVEMHDGNIPDGTPLDETNKFGSGWCIDGTERDSVLPQTEDYIRQSDATIWTPGLTIELPVPDEMKPYLVSGIMLVQATVRTDASS